MKKTFFLLSALIPVFWGGCIVIDNDYDNHIAYFNNASSRNVYIQTYYKLDDYYDSKESGYFTAYGISLQNNTISETAAPFPKTDEVGLILEKILFVDAADQKLLKKITGAEYYKMLSSPVKTTVEKNTMGGKTTNYTYYLVITDVFLGDN